ncbi:MAG: SdiA-regulated domain-containing protein [Phycisphaerales bacterium]
MRTQSANLAVSLAAPVAAAITSSATAQVTSVDLGRYHLAGTFNLPPAAAEASAITYNWDRQSLFVLGDEGVSLVEVSKTGTLIGMMTLTGFADTEGLAYLGNGQFAIVEERLQTVYRLTFTPGGTVARSSLPAVNLGPTIGNDGMEGLAFDPPTGKFVLAKEKTPMAVSLATVDFATGAGSLASLFNPGSLGVTDLAEVLALSIVPTLQTTPDRDNLLILSQESKKLLEVSRAGTVLSQFALPASAAHAEGVAIDPDRVIYVCDEAPTLLVLTPKPDPGDPKARRPRP